MLTLCGKFSNYFAFPHDLLKQKSNVRKCGDEQDSAIGNWGELRSTLKGHGVEIGLSNDGTTIATSSGGVRNRMTYFNLLQSEVAKGRSVVTRLREREVA